MENNLIKFIVYCTTCTINNHIYVGVHKTNPNIFDGYIGNSVYCTQPSTYKHPKTKFQYAVKSLGVKNFKRHILAIFDNEDDAYDLEEVIVNKDFIARHDVYNMVLGGKAGISGMNSVKTFQYSCDGDFIAEFSSLKEAAVCVNRNLRSIQRAVQEKHKCAGYFWTTTKFDKLDLSKMHPYEGPNKIPVFQYSETGEYDCCYESIKDAARVLGVSDSNIGASIKLGTKCYNKYFTNVFELRYSVSRCEQTRNQELHQYDLQGNYIASYKSMAEAKKVLGIKSNIYKAVKLGRTCGDFQWSFEKLDKMDPVKPKAGKARRVGKYDKNWNLICEYESLAQCKRENGSGMVHVLTGRDEFAKGFRYKYLD